AEAAGGGRNPGRAARGHAASLSQRAEHDRERQEFDHSLSVPDRTRRAVRVSRRGRPIVALAGGRAAAYGIGRAWRGVSRSGMLRLICAAAALAALAAGAPPALAEAPDIRPGEWEMTVESGPDGGPDSKPEITTDRTCITPEQVREADFARHFSQMEGLEQHGLRCVKQDETATAQAYRGSM